MEGLRLPELLIILALIALLFGPQKLAGLGSGLGKAIRDFKSAMGGEGDAPRERERAGAAPVAGEPARGGEAQARRDPPDASAGTGDPGAAERPRDPGRDGPGGAS